MVSLQRQLAGDDVDVAPKLGEGPFSIRFCLGMLSLRLQCDKFYEHRSIVSPCRCAWRQCRCLQQIYRVRPQSNHLTRLAKQSSGLSLFLRPCLSLAVRLLLLLAVEQTNLSEASMNSDVAAQSDSPGLGFVAKPRLR